MEGGNGGTYVQIPGSYCILQQGELLSSWQVHP